LEEIARSQKHDATKEGMSTPPETGPNGQTNDYTSWPSEEESKIQAQADEAILRGIARGWSNATRYKFGIQQEVSKESVAPKTSHAYKAVAPLDLCDFIKQEHGVAKAMKADDATVPAHLWDKAIFRGLSSLVEKKVLMTLHDCILRKYRLQLWREARRFLHLTHGVDWPSKIHVRESEAEEDADAIGNILWWATRNDWFEYPCGLRLIFFHFPKQKGSSHNVCPQGTNFQKTSATTQTQQGGSVKK
jgi:hypothetical protein